MVSSKLHEMKQERVSSALKSGTFGSVSQAIDVQVAR